MAAIGPGIPTGPASAPAAGRPRVPKRRGGDGAWLRRQREALGLTQVQLGAALGYAPNSIARMERGEMALEPVVQLAIEALLARAG